MTEKKLQEMQEILLGLTEAVDGEDGICFDLGDNVIAGLIAGLPREQFIGGSGALGGSISVAIGHSLMNDKIKGEVFCLIGDGGLGLHIGSLVTAAMNQPHIRNLTIVCLDNEAFGMTGNQRTTASAMGVDFRALGEALKLAMSKTVYDSEELREACLEAKKIEGVKLILAKCLPY